MSYHQTRRFTSVVKALFTRLLRSWVCTTCLLLLSVSLPGILHSEDGSAAEYKFKAVYLYNFLQFIEWPEEALKNDSSPMIVTIIGNDLLDTLFRQTVRNETIKGHPVIVRSASSIDDVPACHVLFVSRGEEKNMHLILKGIKRNPVLLVGESEGFAESGGGINFYFENGKLRFEVNLDALRQARLVASSKLLRLAKIVGGGE